MKRILLFSLIFFLLSDLCAAETLKLATTTSTFETGLLDVIVKPFEQKNGVTVHIISVGSGKAIKLGENGDVDLILVHSRAEEDAFVAAGYGMDRRDVMYNDFVIIGPAADPAKIAGMNDAAAALAKIAAGTAPFISRGDDSGTHKKELSLWKAAGISPDPKKFKYIEAGQGMSAVLRMADELKGYTLTDRSTYEKLRATVAAKILVEHDRRLLNPYGVIAVNPKKHPQARYELAKRFIAWITSPECLKLIENFTINGRQVFFTGTPK